MREGGWREEERRGVIKLLLSNKNLSQIVLPPIILPSTYSLNHINDWCLVRPVLIGCSCLLRDQGPESVQVYSWYVVLVSSEMKYPHTDLSEVAWMAGEEGEKGGDKGEG